MLATFVLWQDEGGYFMQLPAVLLPAIQKRLSMFVLRSRVRLADASEDWVRLGVAGPGAADAVTTAELAVPGSPMGLARTGKARVLRLTTDCLEITMPPAEAASLWDRLAKRCKPAGGTRWDWHLIRAGIPVVLPQTQEELVPQMANFERIGGVSFKKGCYPGQEIVARTQYLGKLKRRLYLAHLATDAAPAPGDPLFSTDMQEQASGLIVNAAASPEGGYDVLAVIQIASVENHPIHWKSLDGPVLEIRPLPYALAE
jgi:folate-binding protein YgfZ